MFKVNTKNTRTTLDYAKNIRPLLLRADWNEGQLSFLMGKLFLNFNLAWPKLDCQKFYSFLQS